MNTPYRDWRHYQQAVAAFFREQGCEVSIELVVQGARGKHAIDVHARFPRVGMNCSWVIECKLWRQRVKKEQVLALKQIVEDVGADRGIIFSESGFQPGAQDAARFTNITLLTSLEEFKRTVHLRERGIQLLYREAAEPDALPVYAFPNADQPQHILLYDDRLFVANWQTGNIAVVNPVTRVIESVIELNKYEVPTNAPNRRVIGQNQPSDMTCADGKLFLGQVFSEFVLVIDIDTKSIIERIIVPGGGEGAIAGSPDGKQVYFASNKVERCYVIDSATYDYQEIPYPPGGRGCMCVLPHPTKPLLYLGIQRGGALNGRSYFGGNCFLATYDLIQGCYVGNLYLAEIENGRSDDATPHCLTFDEQEECLFVGMFQSRRGIYRIDELGRNILTNFRFEPNAHNRHFTWVDPLSQALYGGKLVSVNRNNCELVTLDKHSGQVDRTVFLGEATNGPRALVINGDEAIISYPSREGLIFKKLI